MRNNYRHIIIIGIACLFALSACNVTKNIPEGQHLLNKVEVKVDTRKVNGEELYEYVIQKPNEQKYRIYWYYWAGNDTTTWLKRWAKKVGRPPVIYNQQSTFNSIGELKAEMKNRAYHHAEVETQTDTTGRRDKKINVTYTVTANDPYRVRNYSVTMPEAHLDSLIERRLDRGRALLKPGVNFDMSLLDDERASVSSMLRNRGYYTASKGNFHYLADTIPQNYEVDLTLIFNDSVLIHPFRINKVYVRSGYTPLRRNYKVVDTVEYKGMTILYDRTRFMRKKSLYENIMVRPKQLYNESRSTRTYDFLMSLGSVGRVNIQYEQVDSALLDCWIDISQADIHQIQLGLDGTNKAGDLGVAGRIGYTHHNIFNGAEALSIKLRGGYEFVSGSTNSVLTHDFYEFGITTGLMFPKIHIPYIRNLINQRLNVKTTYEISLDMQERPEYTRNFLNLSWKNDWINNKRTMSHSFNILDINYVIMPRLSPSFEEYLNQGVNSLTRYSYDNVFTAGLTYNFMLTNSNRNRFKPLYTLRFNVETSGNLLNGVFSLTDSKKTDLGQYTIFGNPFAQYIKSEISYSQTIRVDRRNTVAYHFMAGVAYPYGNSTVYDSLSSDGRSSILPFEKRFYSGGPNSVRGWSTRQLGPGSYNGDVSNPATHVGDIKMEFGIEFRYNIINWLEFAVFSDAGNVWTMFNYDNQPNGQLVWNRFYKEIAIGAGCGFRLNFSSLIIRLDVAKRVYDPAWEEGKRWTFFREKIGGNSGFYFAIGYPF